MRHAAFYFLPVGSPSSLRRPWSVERVKAARPALGQHITITHLWATRETEDARVRCAREVEFAKECPALGIVSDVCTWGQSGRRRKGMQHDIDV